MASRDGLEDDRPREEEGMNPVELLGTSRCQSREIADGCQCEGSVGHEAPHEAWGTILTGPPDALREVPFRRTWGQDRERKKA